MQPKKKYDIAVIFGDGIGPEVCGATVEVLQAALGEKQALNFVEYPGGAGTYLEKGTALPEETYNGCLNSDAILHGAAGLPNAVYADGTEVGMDFGLVLRSKLDLYANIRYSKLYQGTTSHLRYPEPGDIDYVVLRENVEGLYSSRGGGTILRDIAATDTLLITREGTERVARMAFEIARKRNGAPEDGKRRVTVCDKANVLRSYAFFRKVCKEVAKDYPDVELECTYVDALSAFMVTRPSHFDVIVSENMFGDIISDLAAATVGGLGLSPTAELGDTRGYFQAAHGSAPDIAGQGIANPTGTILSGVLMLEWLSEKYGDQTLADAAGRIRRAIEELLADGTILTRDLGGNATTKEVVDAICGALK